MTQWQNEIKLINHLVWQSYFNPHKRSSSQRLMGGCTLASGITLKTDTPSVQGSMLIQPLFILNSFINALNPHNISLITHCSTIWFHSVVTEISLDHFHFFFHTSAHFISMLACDGDAARQHSNKVGTMWPRTINIPQCHGHSGGICLPGPFSLLLFSRSLHTTPPVPPSSTPLTPRLLFSLSLFLYLQSCSATQSFVERRSMCCWPPHAVLVICISEE